jgi:predicted nucleic-acid-binding Zn-ribbon protein
MGTLCIYQAGCYGINMTQDTDKCPKCGSSDWKLPRHIRTRGVTSAATADLNIITCKKCGFTEFYELTEEELVPINKKAAKIFIFAAVVPTLIGIGVSIWLIWG